MYLVDILISQIDDHDGYPINMHDEYIIIIAGNAIGTRLLNSPDWNENNRNYNFLVALRYDFNITKDV